MRDVALVFRGTVVLRKTLAQRVELRGRERYEIIFKINEYWKGPARQQVIIYGVDDGTDCRGGSEYEAGRDYHVYASEEDVKDVVIDGVFWYGWADLLPAGTKMLVPAPCHPGGETAEMSEILRELGKGRTPSGDN